MYKAGDRFIIEIEEVFTGKATGYPQYRIKGFDKLIMDDKGLVKLRKYENKQKQDTKIKVGDEVKIIGSDPMYDDYCDYGVCTYVHIDKIYVMRKDGSASTEHESEWEKTGRTFPQIAEVLKEMRGAENDE